MRAFRLGRVFGIELRIDWSWLIIFALLTWSLLSVFSHWHPGWSPALVLGVAIAGSIIFFLSVLIHEMAHSIVAKGYGIQVRNITLFLFGGVSNIEKEPPSAKAEFFTAIVGPITSIALGIGFLALAGVFMAMTTANGADVYAGVTHLGPVGTLFAWLGPINIIIGVFNLLPAFPLDGGRVLRSIVWGVTGDLRASTRWVSLIGQGFAWLLIATGIAMAFGVHVPFFGTGLVSGLWLAFIGWFLNGAASQAQVRLAIDDALAGLTVRQLMRRTGASVTPDLPVAQLVHDYLVPAENRSVAVMRDGEFAGVVSMTDVRSLPFDRWETTKVGEIMTPADATTVVGPEEPLAEAFERLAKLDVGQLPVIEDGALVGMLSRRDVTRWIEMAWRPVAGGHGRPRGPHDLHPRSA